MPNNLLLGWKSSLLVIFFKLCSFTEHPSLLKCKEHLQSLNCSLFMFSCFWISFMLDSENRLIGFTYNSQPLFCKHFAHCDLLPSIPIHVLVVCGISSSGQRAASHEAGGKAPGLSLRYHKWTWGCSRKRWAFFSFNWWLNKYVQKSGTSWGKGGYTVWQR